MGRGKLTVSVTAPKTAASRTPARASRGTRRESANSTASAAATDMYSTGRRYEGESTMLYATETD